MAAPLQIRLPDGEWTCRWVQKFHYGKDLYGGGVSVKCIVSYMNSDGLIKNLYSPLNILYRTVAGTRLVVKDHIAHAPDGNPGQNRKIYTVEVTAESLFEYSKPLFMHLGMDYNQYKQAISNDTSFKELTSKLQLPSDFAFAQVHCLPNPDSSSPIQYFIVPSYEILRYFFLQGNTLPHELLSYFTGQADKEKGVCQSITELVAHPTGEPLIVPYKGKQVAYLEVKEGLSKAEVWCLARIAFVSQAEECLEQLKDRLLLNSVRPSKLPEEWNKTLPIKTVLPQNQPFAIAACGSEFSWQGNSYLLIEQLYDVKENMPFDTLSYRPLVDHRSKAITPKTADRKKVPSRAKTVAADSATLTGNESGNANQPTKFSDSVDTVSVFGVEPEIIKLPKKSQTERYHTIDMSPEESDLLSLLEQGLHESRAGRAQIDADAPFTVLDTNNNVRNLFRALKLLRNYTCTYLDLDHDIPSLRPDYYLNRARPGCPYKVMIGVLKPASNSVQTTIYIVWASTIRYALFYEPALKGLELSVLVQYWQDIFSKNGIVKMPAENLIRFCHRYNPASLSVNSLVDKIEKDLRNITNEQKTWLR